MTKRDKQQTELEDAIRLLWKDDPQMGFGFLEVPQSEPQRTAATSWEARIDGLETWMIEYVILLAAQLEELGEEEEERLMAEARATLMGIRQVRYWLRA